MAAKRAYLKLQEMDQEASSNSYSVTRDNGLICERISQVRLIYLCEII